MNLVDWIKGDQTPKPVITKPEAAIVGVPGKSADEALEKLSATVIKAPGAPAPTPAMPGSELPKPAEDTSGIWNTTAPLTGGVPQAAKEGPNEFVRPGNTNDVLPPMGPGSAKNVDFSTAGFDLDAATTAPLEVPKPPVAPLPGAFSVDDIPSLAVAKPAAPEMPEGATSIDILKPNADTVADATATEAETPAEPAADEATVLNFSTGVVEEPQQEEGEPAPEPKLHAQLQVDEPVTEAVVDTAVEATEPVAETATVVPDETAEVTEVTEPENAGTEAVSEVTSDDSEKVSAPEPEEKPVEGHVESAAANGLELITESRTEANARLEDHEQTIEKLTEELSTLETEYEAHKLKLTAEIESTKAGAKYIKDSLLPTLDRAEKEIIEAQKIITDNVASISKKVHEEGVDMPDVFKEAA